VKTPACGTVFIWVRGFNSGKETAQAAVHEWYCNPPEGWLSEAIWELSRRWQHCITWVGNILSWQLFNIEPTDNKAAVS